MRDLIIVESDGKRRRAVEKTCRLCGSRFLDRAVTKKPKQYCTSECRRKDRTTSETITCANCRKAFAMKPSRRKSSRSGFHFCSRKCKDEAQRIGGVPAIMPPHYGTGTGKDVYRRQFIEEDLVCRRCGYAEFVVGVDIHHIDGNDKNNEKVNLIPLCACCHRALHSRLWSLDDLLGM